MAGRPESPLDPHDGPVQRLAFELRALRVGAGSPTYREMARRAGSGASTLSHAAAGERLPTLAALLAYVRACGGDPAEWEERWHRTAREAADRPPEDADADPPYRGLGRFEPGDQDLFFGRDRLVAQLADRVCAQRLVAVVGASGSGKSSLLRAGLIPVLRAGELAGHPPAAIRILTPGLRPFSVHGALLVPSPRDGDTVVVIDQFEELFTLCADPAEQAAFLDLMVTAVDPGSRLRVVIAVRADFFGRCAEHQRLTEALREATLLVGPMDPADLREAIVKPAAAVGMIVERELTARIVAEVADKAGGLPLMSHALMETWHRRKGRALTLAAYEAAGGVHGALARTADRLYSRLSHEQALTAQRILLRLVTPGQGVPDTGRPATRAELVIACRAGEGSRSAVVIERLALARLITLDGETVTLAHEALLTAWPRLRTWIDEARDRMRLHRRLILDTRTWQELGHDAGALYRGMQLSTARSAFAGHRDDLTRPERRFLDASADAQEKEVRVATRTSRRVRFLVAPLSLLLLFTLLVGAATWQRSRHDAAVRVQNATLTKVMSLADSLRDTNPRRSMQLTLAAYRIADTGTTRSALMTALVRPEQDTFDVAFDGTAGDLFLADRGRTVLGLGAQGEQVWDVSARREGTAPVLALGAPSPGLGGVVAVSDDGTVFAEQTGGGALQLVGDDGRPLGRPFGTAAGTPALDRRGHTVAVMDRTTAGTTVRLQDVRHGRLLLSRPAGSVYERPVAVSPDGRFAAWCQDDGRLQLWNAVGRHRVAVEHDAGTLCPHAVSAAAPGPAPRFSPDSRSLAVLDTTGAVRRWGVDGRASAPLTTTHVRSAEWDPGTGDGEAVLYSADGRFLAAVDADGMTLWRLDRPAREVWYGLLGGSRVDQPVLDTERHSFRYLTPGAPDGRALPGRWSVRTVDLGAAVTPDWNPRAARAVALSADGTASAVLPAGSGTAQLEIRSPAAAPVGESVPGVVLLPGTRPGRTGSAPPMSFSANGRVFAYAVAPGRVRLWDTARRRVTSTIGPARSGVVTAFALDADGTRLAVLSTRGTGSEVDVWDVRKHRRVQKWPDVRDTAPVVFGPDAGLLAAATAGSSPRYGADLFNLADPLSTDPGHALPDQDGGRWTMAFSPDGHRLAVAAPSGEVTLWRGDGSTGSDVPVSVASGSGFVTDPALAFSPRGNLLAVGDRDGTLRLWNAATGTQEGPDLPTPGDPVQALAFGPDGDTLYSLGTRTPLQAHAVDPEVAARRVCARIGNAGLSTAEWQTYVSVVRYRAICPR